MQYPASSARTAGGTQYVEASVAHVLDRELSVPPGTFEAVRTLARVGAAVASASRPFPVAPNPRPPSSSGAERVSGQTIQVGFVPLNPCAPMARVVLQVRSRCLD
jgi:hypothetical protein